MPADIGIRVYRIDGRTNRGAPGAGVYEAVVPAMKLTARGKTVQVAVEQVRQEALSLLKRWEADLKEYRPEEFGEIPDELEDTDFEPLKWEVPEDEKKSKRGGRRKRTPKGSARTLPR